MEKNFPFKKYLIMKAQFVYENLDFERGADPKTSMDIGSMARIIQRANEDRYDVNKNNPDLDRLIQWAAGYGTIEDMDLLMSKGASPDGDMDFVTPLMSAALRKNWENFYHLIDKGAQIKDTDQSLLGNILRDPNNTNQNSSVPELLKAINTIMKRGYQLEPFDFYRLYSDGGGGGQIFDYMIEKWYPTDINSDFTMEVIDLAPLTIYKFLEKGFDPNYKNSAPLQLAFKNKNPAIFSTLIEKGAIPRDKLINTILNNPKHHKYLAILKEFNLVK